jgi:hypothetical protein
MYQQKFGQIDFDALVKSLISDGAVNVIGRLDRLLIAEAPVMRTWLQGKNIAESGLRQETGVNVVGIWEKNQSLHHVIQDLSMEAQVIWMF